MSPNNSNCLTRDLLKNAAPFILALVVTCGFFYFIYLLYISGEIPEKNAAQLNILLGGIGVVWAKAIGFFYDSSASSKGKDEALQEIAKSSSGTGTGNPVNIPDAAKVTVSTETGDVNIPATNKEIR